MVKRLFSATAIVLLLAAFSPVSAQLFHFKKRKHKEAAVTEVKFLEGIEAGVNTPAGSPAKRVSGPQSVSAEPVFAANEAASAAPSFIESASNIQLKYSILLNTEVEQVKNLALFRLIDEWFGTRYSYGGSTKNGIDCSAFMQVLCAGAFGMALPRTSKEQYKACRSIDKDELKEGDLIFFNTTGGVSHVGMYLLNNKFVHAATSGGVMISDLDEAYWSRRYLGCGRYEPGSEATASTLKP